MPEGLTSIGNCAFYDCDSLEEITIPETVKSIGSSAFQECRKLKGTSKENQYTR
ncbi:MAG: leucine-rich repeat protein [Oscillospiraceae bacterium]